MAVVDPRWYSENPTMATLWERLQTLEGQTLTTVSGRAAFDIVAVNGGFIRIVLHGTGKIRSLQRREFEDAEALGLVSTGVLPSQIRQAGISEFNPAYVAAVIRAIAREGQVGQSPFVSGDDVAN